MASRKKKALLWSLGGALALVAALAIAFAIWAAVTSARLTARINALRKAGESASLDDLLAQWPDPPPGRNAAPILEAAFKECTALRDAEEKNNVPVIGTANVPDPGSALAPETVEGIRACFARHGRAFRLLHQATALDDCKFDVANYRWANPGELNADGAELSGLRTSARVLALEVIGLTEEGKADEAAESLRAGLRLGYLTRHEPFSLTALVRIACESFAIENVERWLVRAKPSPRAMRRVEEALRLNVDPKRLEMPLVGDRCNILTNGLPLTGSSNSFSTAYDRGAALWVLGVQEAYLRAARKPYPVCFLEGIRLSDSPETRVPILYPQLRTWIPDIANFWLWQQRIVARLESTRMGMAALRYKARHGQLPENLEQLVPDFVDAVTLDPFDGKPLRYRRDSERFVVYSVSENGQDDGGDVAFFGPTGTWPPDLGFGFRWPKHATTR